MSFWQIVQIAYSFSSQVFPSRHSRNYEHSMVKKEISCENDKSYTQDLKSYEQKQTNLQRTGPNEHAYIFQSLKEQKGIELSMIVNTDTISNPKAMMIIPQNANTTFKAMTSSIRYFNLAKFTKMLLWLILHQYVFGFHLNLCFYLLLFDIWLLVKRKTGIPNKLLIFRTIFNFVAHSVEFQRNYVKQDCKSSQCKVQSILNQTDNEESNDKKGQKYVIKHFGAFISLFFFEYKFPGHWVIIKLNHFKMKIQ